MHAHFDDRDETARNQQINFALLKIAIHRWALARDQKELDTWMSPREPIDSGSGKARRNDDRCSDPHFACRRISEKFNVLHRLPQFIKRQSVLRSSSARP